VIPPDRALRGLPLAILDAETTGRDPNVARVVQIAVVHAELGDETSPRLAFTSLVKPPIPIPPDSTAIHGITDADVAGAPDWMDVAADVLVALKDRVVVAYNAPYDYGVVHSEMERLAPGAGDDIPWPWLCLLVAAKLADRWEKGRGRHTLSAVLRRRGILVDAHGAAGDAMATAKLATPLLRDLFRGPSGRNDQRAAAHRAIAATKTAGPFLQAIAAAGLELERDFATFANGSAIDAPWHALAGLPAPIGKAPPPRPGTCRSCGASILWIVTKNGSDAPVDAEAIRVVTQADAAGIPEIEAAPSHSGFVGVVQTRGHVVADDVRPDLPRAELRRSHFATCPNSAQHRKAS
jgi:DNA polymerase III epsilon subunit-like protein